MQIEIANYLIQQEKQLGNVKLGLNSQPKQLKKLTGYYL